MGTSENGFVLSSQDPLLKAIWSSGQGLVSIRQRQDERARIERSKEVAYALSASYRAFVEHAWSTVEPARPFIPTMHVDAIAEHLQAVADGQIARLVISIPPGHTKSTLASVMFHPWVWTRDPVKRFISTAYGGVPNPSTRDAIRARALIESPWYQETFRPDWRMRPDRNLIQHYENTRTGYRLSFTVGSGTGLRADVQMVDDPLSVSKQDSTAELERVLFWWDHLMSNRVFDPLHSARIIIMQRLSERDLAGEMLARGGWEHLCLPSLFEPDKRCVTSIGWTDPRTVEGELLFPALYPQSVIDQARKDLGERGFSAQHQQRPSPATGGIFKRYWWRFWKHAGTDMPPVTFKNEKGEFVESVIEDLPDGGQESQSWDCLDSKTEILTADGWRGIGQVNVGDMVYSRSVDGNLRLVPVQRYGERFPRGGEKFVRLQSGRISLRVTEGHTIHALYPKTSNRKRSFHPVTVTGRELFDRHGIFKLPIAACFDYEGIDLTDDELRLIAWFITDGGFSNRYFQISQSKDYKHEIRELLVRLDLDFIERKIVPTHGFATDRECSYFMIPKGTKTGKYRRNGWIKYAQWLDKNIAPELMQMSRRQFGVFWSELMKGNGDLSNGYLCCGNRREQAEKLQAMAVTRGYSSSSHSRPSPTKTPMWYVSARDKRWITSNPKAKQGTRLTLENPQDGDRVWCVQVEHSTLVTRRDGRVSIVGNCAFKGAADSDYVCGGVLRQMGSQYYLLHIDKRRLDFPGTCAAIREMSAQYPNAVAKYIEDKANGPAVMATLAEEIEGLIAVEPLGGKVARANAVAPKVEAGNVYLPHPQIAPWVRDFIDSLAAFPNGKHDDDVDMLTQALARSTKMVFPYSNSEIIAGTPADIGPLWRRCWGMFGDWKMAGVVWLAENPETRVWYAYAEHYTARKEIALHVDAIKQRGAWIPGVLDVAPHGDRLDTFAITKQYQAAGLRCSPVIDIRERGVEMTANMLGVGSLKVCAACPSLLAQYAGFSRDKKGDLPKEGSQMVYALMAAVVAGTGRSARNPGKPAATASQRYGGGMLGGLR